MTLKINPEEEYDEKLCKIVYGQEKEIWNNDWLKGNIKSVFKKTSIVDKSKIDKLSTIPEPSEIKVFDNYSNL